MDPSQVSIPPLKDLTVDNITQNVKLINSQCPDARLKYILDRLVQHVHDFAREARLSHEEWMAGLLFLTAVGKKCTDSRQEFILLSDVLGLSLLVDSISHPKPPLSTQSTVLGPFHSHEAASVPNGASIAHDPDGTPCLVLCSVRDTHGKPLENVRADIWETDSHGFYDVQYQHRTGPDQRAVLRSDSRGKFWFSAIVPVSYPIPSDGPVGQLLRILHRHCHRPAHMHFLLEKDGYDRLITALYLRHDPYESSDAVFGVKESLVVELGRVTAEQAETYGVAQGERSIAYEFVLVTDQEAKELREKEAREAVEKLGPKVKLHEGLPVMDVD